MPPSSSCIVYLFADRHIGSGRDDANDICPHGVGEPSLPRKMVRTSSSVRVNECALNGVLTAVGLWSLWTQSLIVLSVADALPEWTPWKWGRSHRKPTVPDVRISRSDIDLAHQPPFLNVSPNDTLPRIEDPRPRLSRFFKPTADVVGDRLHEGQIGRGPYERRLLACLIALVGQQPVLRNANGVPLTSIDVGGYLAREVGGFAHADCRAEAKAHLDPARLRNLAEDAELNTAWTEFMAAWNTTLASHPIIHRGICGRALAGVVLAERLWSD